MVYTIFYLINYILPYKLYLPYTLLINLQGTTIEIGFNGGIIEN